MPVSPPTPAGPAAETCRALLAGLPDTLDGRASRAVTPTSPYTAAWGDPLVVLRCGVPRPAGLSLTSMLVTVDGVDWFLEQPAQGSDPVRFTATGRAVYVEVTVSGARASAVNPLVDLAGPLTKADPRTTGTG